MCNRKSLFYFNKVICNFTKKRKKNTKLYSDEMIIIFFNHSGKIVQLKCHEKMVYLRI